MNLMAPLDFSIDLCVKLADILTDAVRELVGDEAVTGLGKGPSVPLDTDHSFSAAVRRYEQAILTAHDYPLQKLLGGNAHLLAKRVGGWQVAKDYLYPLVMDLSVAAARSGVAYDYQGILGTNIETGAEVATRLNRSMRLKDIGHYLLYFNIGDGGPYRGLVSPEFAALYALCYPGCAIRPECLYAPQVTLGSREVGKAYISAERIDDTRYAGAVPVISHSGIKIKSAAVGTVTFSGIARTRTGRIEGFRSWTAVVPVGDGIVEAVPDIEGDLCIAVDNIIPSTLMTAGALMVSSGEVRRG